MANLAGQGPAAAHGASTDFTTKAYHQLGTRARDTAGNEYLYVDFGKAFDAGEWVVWDTSFVATAITINTQEGPCGIVAGHPDSSDTYGWVQIYGVNTQALVTSDVTSGQVLQAATTATTEGYLYPSSNALTSSPIAQVIGARTYTAASTATTSDVPATCTVWLNFPYLKRLEITS